MCILFGAFATWIQVSSLQHVWLLLLLLQMSPVPATMPTLGAPPPPPKKQGTRYFIIRSYNFENIDMSISHGVWATQSRNDDVLNTAYARSERVVLFFSVNSSAHFQGMAFMVSPVGRTSRKVPWEGNFNSRNLFSVDWECLCDMPHADTEHLRNGLNENRPIHIARDGQEVSEREGAELMHLMLQRARHRGFMHPGPDRLPPQFAPRERYPDRPGLRPMAGPLPHQFQLLTDEGPINRMMHGAPVADPMAMAAMRMMNPAAAAAMMGSAAAGMMATAPPHRARSRSRERHLDPEAPLDVLSYDDYLEAFKKVHRRMAELKDMQTVTPATTGTRNQLQAASGKLMSEEE